MEAASIMRCDKRLAQIAVAKLHGPQRATLRAFPRQVGISAVELINLL